MNKESLTLDQQFCIAYKLAGERLPRINAEEECITPPDTFYVKHGKRIVDFLIALPACILTLPINLAIGIGTAFDVGKPLFFKQTRVGKNGHRFEVVKFRNMKDTRDMAGNLLPAAERVTKFGSFIRKTSLDELLNFWFILKGDMSLIGPRPLVPEYDDLYSNRHKCRLLLRPGLECPPHERNWEPRTWHSRFENDTWYVENVSFKTDCKLILNLIKLAFDSNDANKRANGSEAGSFLGYTDEGIAMNLEGITEEELARLYPEIKEEDA